MSVPLPLRALAVSRDARWLAALPGLLAAAGFAAEVVAAADAAAFTGALRGSLFDVVLSDGGCPQLTLAAAAEILRHSRQHPPLLFVAGSPGENAVAAALRAGAADYVSLHEPQRLAPALREAGAVAKQRHHEQEAANHHRMLLEDAQVGIYLLQGDRIIYANPRLAEIFGYTREELLALPQVGQLVIPEDRDLVAQKIRRRESGDTQVLRYGFRGVRKDGEPVEVEVFGVTTRADGGAAIFGTVLDTTAQRRVERELQQSVAVLRGVLEGSSEGVLALSRDGVILASNRRFAELWHVSDEVMTAGDDAAIFAQVLAQIASPGEFLRGFGGIGAGEPAPPPAQIHLKSGRILERSANLFEARSVCAGQVYNFREVTAELRLAHKLQRSETRLRAVLQHASDIITLIDRAGIILYESPVIGRILGYRAEELSGQSIFSYLHPDDHVLARERIGALLAGPGEPRTANLRFRRKDGSWAWLESIAVNRLADPEIGAIVISSRDISERIQIETALRDSEVRFKLFMDNFPGLAFIKDDSGRMIYVNKSYAIFFGASQGELIGRMDRDIIGEAASVRRRAQDAEVVSSGEASHQQDTLTAFDGTRHTLMILKFPLMLTPTKRLLGGIALDISDREQMAAALRDSEERFRLFMDNNPALAFIKDENGRYTYVNRPYEQFFGQPPGAWLGRSDEDLLPETIAAQYRANDAAVLASGKSTEFNETSIDSEGRERTSLVLKFPLRDGQGRRFVGGMALDITQRKRAEEQLRLQSSALDAAANGMVITDRDGVIEWINPAFTAITGYDAAEAIGKVPGELLKSGRHEPAFYQAMWATVLRGDIWRGDVINRRKDGSLYTEDMTITPIRNDRGEIDHFIAVKQDISRRKQMEEALRQSEARTGSLVRNSYDLITLLNPAGEMLYHSPAIEQITGFTPAETINRSQLDFVHPDDREALIAKTAELVKFPDRRLQAVWRCRHKSGHWVWLESVGTNLLGDAAVGALVINSRDITERKHAEMVIGEANRTLNALLDNIPSMFFVKDATDLRFVRFNKAGEELLGIPSSEMLGKNDYDFFPKAEAEHFIARDREVLQSGVLLDIPEEQIHTRSHGLRWLHTKKIPVFDAAGAPRYLLGISEDITERRQAEEGLARALQRLRLHIENAPLAVIEWSREARVTAWNPAAEQMFGHAAAAAAGRTADFIATEASRAQIAEMFAQLLRRKGAGDSPVLEQRTADGRLIHCQWFNTPLIDRDGNVFAFASMIQDVSELLRTRRELEEFIFTTAHDLKAPLLSVKAFAELASRAAGGQSALAEPLARVTGNALRMESLVSGVLEYARLGYRERREEWIALGPFTSALLAATIPPDDEAIIELSGRDRPAYELLIDPRDFERILSNLVSNARNYRDPHRRLRITLGLLKGSGAQTGYYAISISDNGTGIAPEQHQYVFRLFTRLGGDGAPGHGLGLAIIKRLTEDYGGSITLDSLPEGTRFNLWLPASRFRRAANEKH